MTAVSKAAQPSRAARQSKERFIISSCPENAQGRYPVAWRGRSRFHTANLYLYTVLTYSIRQRAFPALDGRRYPMASTVVAGPAVTPDKGLRAGALGLISSVVIAVSSTAPAYSMAATLGLVVA